MMTKPGITELDKYVDSRYTLVSMVAKRARMISMDRRQNETVENAAKNAALDKPVTQAVNEITEGTVGYIRSEAVQKARQYEQEKIEAISQLDAEASDAE
ncbi:MAG: DNA-directed RNA polymerase subunit omega [Clostridia bacterium]|nr:DNA-directed RNA polymerase subunit omega [Clostridia bacterium]